MTHVIVLRVYQHSLNLWKHSILYLVLLATAAIWGICSIFEIEHIRPSKYLVSFEYAAIQNINTNTIALGIEKLLE